MNVNLSPAAMRLDYSRHALRQAAALIFDVDGTLAETEEVHRQAFNEAFVKTGLDWCWGRTVYKELLQVAGGKERIRAFDSMRPGPPLLSDDEVAELHRIKTDRYVELIALGGCPLRPGVAGLLATAHGRGQRLAIATTTSRANIDALLSIAVGREWPDMFEAIVAGDEVNSKKPAPDVYLEVLRRLDLPAAECLAFEDSCNGLQSAAQAGIAVIVTRSIYFRDDDFSDAIVALDELTELGE
jgi:HAD superfamily hydrolase (TIGR01509 family)